MFLASIYIDKIFLMYVQESINLNNVMKLTCIADFFHN